MSRVEWLGLVLLLLLVALLVIPIADDFGISTDELANVRYGEVSLQAYMGADTVPVSALRKQTGSFYFMVWVAWSRWVDRVTAWSEVDARHYLNFLMFLVAVGTVYVLCRRLVSVWAAAGATALFATQPLLFGHGFINQKDTPFMAFFAVAVATGLSMVDQLGREKFAGDKGLQVSLTWPTLVSMAGRGWRDSGRVWMRWTLIVLVVFGVLLTWELFFAHSLILPGIRALVLSLYHQTFPFGWANELFLRLAERRTELPAEAYIHKATALYLRLRWAVVALVACLVGALSLYMFWEPVRVSLRWAGEQLLVSLRLKAVNRRTVGAGVLLGLAMGTRPPGLFAGALVALYALWRLGLRSMLALTVYFVVGAVTTFAIWPALWGAPVHWYLDSLQGNLDFPGGHEVLFRGVTYRSFDLPWDYLPWLLFIQLTPPAVALFVTGLVLLHRYMRRPGIACPTVAIFALWFGLPALGVIALRIPIYSNFRQLMFILPPLFVIAGISFQWLSERFRGAVLLGGVLVASLPGLLGLVRLHPYQYVYYNTVVGGLKGAERQYMLDYWCTSYRELMDHLNRVAPHGARISGWGPVFSAEPFAREDLLFVKQEQAPDYVLACSWGVFDRRFFPQARVVWEVRRGGAVLGHVKQVRMMPEGPCALQLKTGSHAISCPDGY